MEKCNLLDQLNCMNVLIQFCQLNIKASKMEREALNIENKKVIMKMKKIRNVMATELYLSVRTYRETVETAQWERCLLHKPMNERLKFMELT